MHKLTTIKRHGVKSMTTVLFTLFALAVTAMAAMADTAASTLGDLTTGASDGVKSSIYTVMPPAIGVLVLMIGVGIIWSKFKKGARSG